MKKYLLLLLIGCFCLFSCKKEDPNKVYKTAIQENVVYLKSATIIQYTIKGRFMSR